MSSKKIISVVGSAGAGKSTVVPLLAKKLNLTPYLEDSEDNPMLTAWYLDRPKWNYWIQLFFHSRRVTQHYLAEKEGGVLERSIYEDLIFYNLSVQEKAEGSERKMHELLKIEIDNILKIAKRPDKIIYLKISAKVQFDRITKRDRLNETKIEKGFLKKLNEQYELHFGDNGIFKPDITIDTDSLKINEVFSQIINKI